MRAVRNHPLSTRDHRREKIAHLFFARFTQQVLDQHLGPDVRRIARRAHLESTRDRDPLAVRLGRFERRLRWQTGKAVLDNFKVAGGSLGSQGSHDSTCVFDDCVSW